MQPKSNVIFKLTSIQLIKFLAEEFGFKFFLVVATVPTGLQTCAKVLQMHLSGSGGTSSLQSKSNETLKLSLALVLKFLAVEFGFKICL